MINILVHNDRHVQIDNRDFIISSRFTLIQLIREILNKSFYAGEVVCLGTGSINEKNEINFTEVERWVMR